MKYNFFRIGSALLVLTIIVIILTTGFLAKPAKEAAQSAGKGFAVIELFTSEGCSSCPAADAEVEKIAALYPDNVYVLGFHVDYWNRLGWKDEFSSAAYSERQKNYAGKFKLDGVYTPQVVVNGKDQFVGSDDAKLTRAVNVEIKKIAVRDIEFSASFVSGKTVQVTYNPDASLPGTDVNIALIQTTAQTNVKGGENEGRLLHHINIVRDFKTISKPAKPVTADLLLPNGISAKECKVIVYLQNHDTREVTTAAACFIK